MPNGISCAFFACKNLIYGQKENNVFKEGIAGAQAARTIDSAAQAGVINAPVKVTGKIAKLARRIVYPLIMLSGVYNTVKSDDKIKTGASQAGGIASMYAFEQIAEKGLNIVNNKLSGMNCCKNNKYAKIALYAAKGAAFAAASIAGYNFGSKTSGNIVDGVRKHKNLCKNQESNPLNQEISNIRNEKDKEIFSDFDL